MNLSGVIQNEEDAIREIERRSALKTNSYEVIIGIQKELKEFDATIDQLQILANSEPPGLRDEARMRISNLKSSCSYVKSIVEMTLRKRFKQTISDQQEELFSMAGRQTDIEAEVETGKSLDMSLNNISNAIHTGRDTMQELSSQKERLKVRCSICHYYYY